MKAFYTYFLPIITTVLLVDACRLGHDDRLRSGDLIFVGMAASPDDSTSICTEDKMSGAIVSATGDGQKNYIHVAIVDVDDSGEIYMLDADDKRGVSRRPVDSFLEDFKCPEISSVVFDVMRVTGVGRRQAAKAVERARAFEGESYDWCFLPDNGAHYCSELVYDCFLDRKGRHVFSSEPMNFLSDDGSLPKFWEELFSGLGMEVPQGVQGTNPQDMSRDPHLKVLDITL